MRSYRRKSLKPEGIDHTPTFPEMRIRDEVRVFEMHSFQTLQFIRTFQVRRHFTNKILQSFDNWISLPSVLIYVAQLGAQKYANKSQIGSSDAGMIQAARTHLVKELNKEADSEPYVCNNQQMSAQTSKQVLVFSSRDKNILSEQEYLS